MPRPRILGAAEQEAFDNPPSFTAPERKKNIALSEAIRPLVDTLQTPTNRVCFLVTLAYFRATRRFFARQFHPRDVSYAARFLGVEGAEIDVTAYAQSRAHHHRAMILEYTGWAPFDGPARQLLAGHLRPLVRSHSRPKAMFLQAVDTLQRHKIEVPALRVDELILEAVRRHEQGLVEHIRSRCRPRAGRPWTPSSRRGPRPPRTQGPTLAVGPPQAVLALDEARQDQGQRGRPRHDRRTVPALHRGVRTLDLTPEGLRYSPTR